MGIRVHGVIGGPRQKVSTPRTRVDLTNKVKTDDYFSSVETVIISTRDSKIQFAKYESAKEEEKIQEEIHVEEEKPAPVKKRKRRSKKASKKSETEEPKQEVLETDKLTEDISVNDWLLKLSGESDQSS